MARKRTPSWPFYIDDYERDTDGLRHALEHGAYFLLLKHYWKHGALPAGEDQLRKIAAVDTVQWRRLRPVLQHFFYDGWTHPRLERDLAAQQRFSGRQRQRAARRWEKKLGDEISPLTNQTGFGRTDKNVSKNNDRQMRERCGDDANTESHRLPTSTAAREANSVDKSESLRQDRGSPKKNGSQPPAYRRARQAWENALLDWYEDQNRDPGPALDFLATHPELCDRATKAELRNAGAGVQAAVLALRQMSGA
jgi:uncharacterized protein YdaU (DUF1376 family)